MNTWECARVEVNTEVIVSNTPTPYPNTSMNNKNNMSKNWEERQEFIDLSHLCTPPLPPVKKKQNNPGCIIKRQS